MRTLHHLWLDPFCRKIRLVLSEKGLEYTLEAEPVWERRDAFLALNPAGEVPVWVEAPDNGERLVIAGHEAICEYVDEAHEEPPLIGTTPTERAEARRLTAWFDRKFHAEVYANLVGEKLVKRVMGQGQPDSAAIRAGLANIRTHLDYIGYLMEDRRWLAGSHLSMADLAAAAQISMVDYIGDVPWHHNAEARDWYARIKSRPSFRPLLAERISMIPPSKQYANLDF